MMKSAIVLIALISIHGIINGQVTFQKMYGGANYDYGNSVQQTNDGGYIFSGVIASPTLANSDIFLLKTNEFGDTTWIRTYGGSVGDYAYYTQQTNDGGYIITGLTNSFGIDSSDVYLIKTDLNGDLVWSKTYDGTGFSQGRYVHQTSDGGYIVAGSCANVIGGIFHLYIIKTNAIGDTIWTRTTSANTSASVIKQTADNNYIVFGITINYVGGNKELLLLKVDSTGNCLWSKSYKTGSTDGVSGQQTSDGGYIIAGLTHGSGGPSSDAYLIKTDSVGDILWSRTYGGIPNYEMFSSVQQTNDGGYILTGQTSSFGAGNGDVYLIKTDGNGNLEWSKTFGGTYVDHGHSVQQAIDGGYIVIGSCSNFGSSYPNGYLIKTDSLGNSGCNETSPATIVGFPTTQITSPVINFNFSTTTINNPVTVVNSTGVFTPLCSNVGLNEIDKKGYYSISPNPAVHAITLSFNGLMMNGRVEFLNMLGKCVLKENIFNASEKTINIDFLSQGIYIMKVIDGEISYCKIFIVKRL